MKRISTKVPATGSSVCIKYYLSWNKGVRNKARGLKLFGVSGGTRNFMVIGRLVGSLFLWRSELAERQDAQVP